MPEKSGGKSISTSEVNDLYTIAFIYLHECILLLDCKPHEDHIVSIPNVWSMTGP